MPKSFRPLDHPGLARPGVDDSNERRTPHFEFPFGNGLHGVLFFTGTLAGFWQGRIRAIRDFQTGNAGLAACWTPTTTLNRNEEDRKSRNANPVAWLHPARGVCNTGGVGSFECGGLRQEVHPCWIDGARGGLYRCPGCQALQCVANRARADHPGEEVTRAIRNLWPKTSSKTFPSNWLKFATAKSGDSSGRIAPTDAVHVRGGQPVRAETLRAKSTCSPDVW